MKPSDLARVRFPRDPRLSPDGKTVAFVVGGVDLAANANRSQIWLVPTDAGAAAQPFSAGAARDANPRWSPDGRWLAFTSHREEQGAQIFVLPVGQPGEARSIVAQREEIDDLEWSPDGSTIAFVARQRDEAQYGPTRDADRPPRRTRRLVWRYDNVGWLLDRPAALLVVASDGTGGPRVLVKADRAEGLGDVEAGLAWSPDGSRIAFAQSRHESADIDGVVDLWTVEVTTGVVSRMGETGWVWSSPEWSPDGQRLAVYRVRPRDGGRNEQACVIDITATALGERGDITVVGGDLDRNRPHPATTALRWDGTGLHVPIEDSGRVRILRYALDGLPGGAPEVVLAGDRVITGYAVRNDTLVATVTSPTDPGSVVVVDPTAGERLLAGFPAPFPVAQPESFSVTAADGAEIDAWIMRPLGSDGQDGLVPVLLNVHGGPFTQYGYSFFDEFQVQVEAGYAVVYCNPRGASGRGEAWGRAIRGPQCAVDPGTGWGGVDADDVMAVLDAALAHDASLDADRVGLLGGSYGGYMTSWLIGHTDRFKAACSERAVNSMISMCHTSDIGFWFNVEYTGLSPWDEGGLEELTRISPSTYADRITTPLLILHSEQDWRCPIEQAEDLFTRLRLLGRDVELVRFPGEGHELSRSGAPKHRLARFDIQLDFFARHLKPTP